MADHSFYGLRSSEARRKQLIVRDFNQWRNYSSAGRISRILGMKSKLVNGFLISEIGEKGFGCLTQIS